MKVPLGFFSPVIGVLFLSTIFISQNWELPTLSHKFSDADSGSESRKVEMVVQGLHCRGTANFFVRKIGETPGLLSLTTFVQKHSAQIEYDPTLIGIEEIRREIEEPVRLRDGRMARPFKVVEIKEQ